MAHPYIDLVGQPGKQQVLLADLTLCRPVFSRRRVVDLATERVTGQLHAVANAKHGDAQAEQLRIASGRAFFVNAHRTARQDDPLGSQLGEPVRSDIVTEDLAVDVLVSYASGDQLGVLRSEVENNDSLPGQL